MNSYLIGILRNYLAAIALQPEDLFDLYFMNMLPYLHKIVIRNMWIIEKRLEDI